MKSQRLIVIAILLGVAAVLLVNAQFNKLKAKVKVPTTVFYRAAKDVLPGVTVHAARKSGDLVPVKSIPTAFAKSYPYAVDEAEYSLWAKKKILRPLHAGEFLHVDHMKDHSYAEVTRALPKGWATLGISVTQESSSGFLVVPGDTVDVYQVIVGRNLETEGGKKVSTVKVASGLTALAVDGVYVRPGEHAPNRMRGKAYSTITLAGPEDAINLVRTARVTGKKIELSLVSSRPE